MKIAYFLDTPVGLGGAGNLLLERARLMSELYDVLVIIPCDRNKICNLEYAFRCKKYGLRYESIYYNTSNNFYDIDLLKAYESYNAIEKLVIDEKITFLHSVQLNIVVEMISRNLKIPHLMDVYQMEKDEFEMCPGDIFAHYHLCDSIKYSQIWEKNMNIVSKCIRPIAPLKQILKKEKYATDKFKILMLGTVSERKNQLSAIKVIEKCILKYDVQLLIVGDKNNSYGEKCERYIKEAKLENKVCMLGFLSDVTDVLKESDFLLCTSLNESFPSSMVEAVTYDLTIISTPVAGVPELFKDNYNSFISKNFSVNSIYDSVCDCIESYKNQTINKIHENVYNTWKNNFDRNKIQKKLNEYYKQIEKEVYSKQKSIQPIWGETTFLEYLNFMNKKIEQRKDMSDKHLTLFQMMNQWVKVKQEGKNLSQYFETNNYKNIAIYGMSYAGETLVDELRNTNTNVKYGIDKNADRIYSEVNIVTIEDDLEEVDAIVVTAITFFDEIVEKLEAKVDYPIISLEDILYEI